VLVEVHPPWPAAVLTQVHAPDGLEPPGQGVPEVSDDPGLARQPRHVVVGELQEDLQHVLCAGILLQARWQCLPPEDRQLAIGTDRGTAQGWESSGIHVQLSPVQVDGAPDEEIAQGGQDPAALRGVPPAGGQVGLGLLGPLALQRTQPQVERPQQQRSRVLRRTIAAMPPTSSTPVKIGSITATMSMASRLLVKGQ
jgi:hypothetical protein